MSLGTFSSCCCCCSCSCYPFCSKGNSRRRRRSSSSSWRSGSSPKQGSKVLFPGALPLASAGVGGYCLKYGTFTYLHFRILEFPLISGRHHPIVAPCTCCRMPCRQDKKDHHDGDLQGEQGLGAGAAET